MPTTPKSCLASATDGVNFVKIWRGRRKKDGTRDVVVDLTVREEHEVRDLLLGVSGRRAPKRVMRRDGTVRYRFGAARLDRLLAMFPFAELSTGLERRASRMTLSAVTEPVPDLDIPDLRAELYDFQKIGVKRILEGFADHGNFFLNDEMGLGKTMQALAVMVKLLPTPILVVCPNSAKWVWERAIAEFTSLHATVIDADRQNAARRGELIRAADEVTVMNIEALRLHEDDLATVTYGLVVSDEVHRFKNPKAKQTLAWFELRSELDLMMTGTPILNRLEEIWAALHRAFPERYPSFFMFEKWLCIKSKPKKIPKRGPDGRIERTSRGAPIMVTIPARVIGYRPDGFKALKAHMHEPLVSLRRRKDQVLDDLPDVVPATVLVELTREQRRLYDRIVNEMKLELENGEIHTLSQIIQVVTRTKQACFSPELFGGTPTSAKLTELKELCSTIVANDRKALIGSQWAKATRIMQRELAEFNPAYVDGTVKGRKRMAQVDKFNEEDDCHLYIGTIGANQEAITLGEASYVVFTDKMWSPLANDQFIARSAAGGLRGLDSAHRQITVVDLFAHDTVEERIEEVLNGKRALFNAFVEADGGTNVSRLTVGEIASLF